jgi:ATP-binding cassette subfamily F protein uup
LQLDDGGRSGALVADLESVSFGYEVALIEGFSTTIRRQDRVGIIGPNGCGKSTLIRLMLGELQPHAGKVNLGTGLQVAYFDQQRSALRSDLSVRESVGEGSDYVEINGKRKHVAGYLADFLFPSRYLNVPVGQLSGGERNRLLMARLFARPANLLVLDEPTNDLDVETLELLEELLSEFAGTIVLVSHDRRFLDRVVTSTIVFEGGGQLREYVGGYSDWQRQRKAAAPRPAEVEPAAKSRRVTSKPRRLSYNDQRELDALPERIEALEASQVELEREVGAPGFYDQPPGVVHEKLQTLADRVAQIEAAYARWQALSDAADLS